MTGVTVAGNWRVRVLRKDSDWVHRVVITGSASLVIPGRVGESAEVQGERWRLTIEHNSGGGWTESAYVQAEPVRRQPGRATQLVMSKDHYWAGDSDPNDLVVMLEEMAGTGMFSVDGQPYGVDESLRPLDSHGLGDPRAHFMAVRVRNTSHKRYGYGARLAVSDAGRRALAGYGILVAGWTQATVRATGQEVFGSAVSVPPLGVGQHAIVYFPVDASGSRAGTTDIEFVLSGAGGPGGGERHTVSGVVIDNGEPARQQAQPQARAPLMSRGQLPAGPARAAGADGPGPGSAMTAPARRQL
jgi:hypothetical protein